MFFALQNTYYVFPYPLHGFVLRCKIKQIVMANKYKSVKVNLKSVIWRSEQIFSFQFSKWTTCESAVALILTYGVLWILGQIFLSSHLLQNPLLPWTFKKIFSISYPPPYIPSEPIRIYSSYHDTKNKLFDLLFCLSHFCRCHYWKC